MVTNKRRTNQQRDQDRNTLCDVLKEAPGWVTFGYIISRVDAGVNQTKQDLRSMTESGDYDILTTPGRGRGMKTRWTHSDNVNSLGRFTSHREGNRARRRTVSKASHPNRCMRWLPAEEQQLVDEVRNGMTLEEMAHKHGRTEKAIENRLYRLSKAGRIAWGTRTGTPRANTDFEKSDETTPSLASIFAPKPPMSFGAQAARHEALHTCVGAFLKGKVTLDGLQNAHDAVTESKGDA